MEAGEGRKLMIKRDERAGDGEKRSWGGGGRGAVWKEVRGRKNMSIWPKTTVFT